VPTRVHKSQTGHISQGHTKPGDGVSSDGLESGTPGRPFTTKCLATKARYNYMSFWVDHASSFVYFLFHSSKAAAELVYSKAKFEQFLACFNVQIRNFRLDNGVYSAQIFCNSYLWHQQHLFFCGVATHWQNRTAEHFIGTVTQQAWTILLHATAKWSLVIKEEMWSFALWHTVNFHNYSV